MNLKETYDLPLASFLSITGHKIISVKSINGKRFAFSFEDSPNLQKKILDFYNHVATVDPCSYAEQMRNLKALVLQR
jgi:hypothetical protein